MSRPQSLAAAAREAGLSRATVLSRKRLGWPEERWFIPVEIVVATPEERERARGAGLTVKIIRDRRARGWPDSDLYLPIDDIAAKARDAGLNPNTVYGRKRKGWPESLLCAPPGTRYRPPHRAATPTDPALWERLEAARKAARMSGAEVSRAIGAHRNWYAQHHKRRHALPPDAVARIETAISNPPPLKK